jgi:hypothetical protein
LEKIGYQYWVIFFLSNLIYLQTPLIPSLNFYYLYFIPAIEVALS